MARSRQLSESSVDSETIETAPAVLKPTKKKAKTTTTTTKGKDKTATKGKGQEIVQPEIDVEPEDVEMQEQGEDDAEAGEEVVVPVKKGKKKVAQKVVEEDNAEEATKAPSANEKRLQRKLDTITLALAEQATAFEQLKELRTTKAEESEKALTEVAAQRQVTAVNTLAKYKQENSQLRQEILTLRSAFPEGSNASLLPTRVVPGSPGSQPNLAEAITKIAELEKSSARFEEENVVLSGKANEAEAELKAAQEILEMVEKELENVRSEKERIEAASEAGKKTAVLEAEAAAKKANKDLLVEVTQLRTELSAEVAHSKSLQLKLKSSIPSTSSTSQSRTGTSEEKLKEELEVIKMRYGLVEDLTGLQITSVKSSSETTIFNCVLTDLLGKTGALHFIATFPLDGTLCYDPKLDPVRDAAILDLLPVDYRSFMRFDAQLSGKWFKALFGSINKIKD